MSKRERSPMQPPYERPQPERPKYDPISYLIGSLEPRLQAAEDQISEWQDTIAAWKAAALTYAKRAGIVCAVWGLALLVNAFPGTEVAYYAGLLHRALMLH